MGNCICFDKEDIYENCTEHNTPFVSFEGLRTKVKVLRVVDGDTVDIAMANEYFKKIYKYRVRLYGIDTPEKKPSKQNANREQEIAAAHRATQAIIDKLKENRNLVTILFHKQDKYGRQLGTLYGEHDENINEWMIQQGYAVSYDGKKKPAYSEK